MNKIIKKEQLSKDVFRFTVQAPRIAKSRKPGQFIILMMDDEHDERIPLTIADANIENGTITLIFQAVGGTTLKLSTLNENDNIAHILGPLGKATKIENKGTVVCVAGGIGAAPLFPIVQGFKAAGNRVITIIGARNKDLMILQDEMSQYSDELILCSDDGSIGLKALVTEPLKKLCETENIAEVVAIGPPIMMKFCAETTRPFKVPTVVSLNTIMVDGTGMCGGCRVTIGDETKFVCVDGPEFDGHLVDFDNMLLRLSAYKKHEAHACKLTTYAEKEVPVC